MMLLPLTERLMLLHELIAFPPPHVLVARHIDASIVPKPVSWLFAQAVDLQLEGVVGKLGTSRYQPGVRAAD